MEPGERITLMKKIAQSFATDQWDEIDLVLEEFGFPTTDDWNNGNQTGYVLAMIRKVRDDVALSKLHDFRYPGEGAPTTGDAIEPQGDPDSPWKTEGFHLFITHLAERKKEAGDLRDALAVYGIEGFVAHQTIEPGAEWLPVIESALNSCEGLTALMTPGMRDSNWCDQEIGFAIGRGLLVVPLRAGQDPYGFVGKYQGIPVDLSKPSPEPVDKLVALLTKHELTRAAMARALVWKYENTTSYDQARFHYGLLKQIPSDVWTDSLRDRARAAAAENSQISDANILGTPIATAVEQLMTATATS